MRTSNDEWKLEDGSIISLSQAQEPPAGATIYNGFDYQNQIWVYQGKKDTRTLEELRALV